MLNIKKLLFEKLRDATNFSIFQGGRCKNLFIFFMFNIYIVFLESQHVTQKISLVSDNISMWSAVIIFFINHLNFVARWL